MTYTDKITVDANFLRRKVFNEIKKKQKALGRFEYGLCRSESHQ